MASYELPPDEAIVVVDDGPYAGAEVVVNRAVGIGTLLDVERLMQRHPDETQEEKLERSQALLNVLDADVLVRWNLADRRGRPIPCSRDGLGRLPGQLVGEIVVGFLMAVRQVPGPFAKPSQPGELAADPSQPS